MGKQSSDQVDFALDEKPTKDAQDVRLSVRVANGRLQVCTGVRSGTTGGSISANGFVAVNAPFMLSTRA